MTSALIPPLRYAPFDGVLATLTQSRWAQIVIVGATSSMAKSLIHVVRERVVEVLSTLAR